MRSYDERARDILQKRDEIIKQTAAKRKKAARLGLIAAVLALMIAGASVFAVIANKAGQKPADPLVTDTDTAADTAVNTDKAVETDAPDTTPKEYKDGVIGERKESDMPKPSTEYAVDGRYFDRSESVKGVSPSFSPEAEGDVIAGEPGDYYNGIVIDAAAGTLTAGEWKDLDNLSDWFGFVEKYGEYVKSRKLNTNNVVTVNVKDGDNACFNVPVKLYSGEEIIYSARTDISGNAYLFGDITGDGKTADAVAVGEEKISLDNRTKIEVQAENAGIEVKALDLLLMIDTTGSMGDELEYIKAELNDVVSRVAEANESVSIRVSVNFYRDEGDEYVVKYYDFRTDINECLEQIKEQYADGGGDIPEAVHTALDNAVTGHEWRDEAVKLCFMVLDAPPHSEYEIQGINSQLLKTVKTAAEQGIRIIPVASSGVDGETEFLLRSWAAMTGGTYIFITNDSGIGFDHKEAEVGEHTVEYLNECMIRVICEYCGVYTGEKIPYTPTPTYQQ